MIHKDSIRGREKMRGGPMRALCVLGVVLLSAPAWAQEAKLVEKSGEWSIYVHGDAGNKTCFAASQPKSQKPEGVKRGPAYFYISSWTEDSVANEISVKMGYPLKEGVPVEITVGGDKFTLFTKAEGAYMESKADEQKLVEAIKNGSTMTVQGRSARDTLTTDEYSLTGSSDAIEGAAKQCS